jgi:hypothetical protein
MVLDIISSKNIKIEKSNRFTNKIPFIQKTKTNQLNRSLWHTHINK